MQIRATRATTMSILLVLVLGTTPIHAAGDVPLEELLIEKGFITQEELDEARREAGGVETEEAANIFEAEVEVEKEPQVKVTVGSKGLIVESPDGDFVFGLGGRLQLDGGGFSGSVTPLGDGVQLRRGRIKSFGTVYGDWDFKLEVNFDGDGKVFPTDAWLRYSGKKPFTIVIGHQKVPFSQQSMTSSNWQVFQERALQDGLIDSSEEGRRRVGVVVGSYGEHWNVYAGVFGEGLTDPGVVDEDWGTAGRAVIAPIADEARVVTLGGAVYYREFKGPSTLRYRSRPESGLASVRLVDTGIMANATDTLAFNAEASFVFGPFHAQGEYTRTEVSRFGASRLTFDGWYTQGGFFITGESRNYDVKSGKYKRIKPTRKIGAWEIAARYSTIDLQDLSVLGGRESNITAGLNWWVNQNVMFRFNYVRAYLTPTTIMAAAPAPQFDQTVNAFMVRTQVVF